MIEGPQDNAMAECALALAMAFFSILVLSLTSMGGEPAKGQGVEVARTEGARTNPDSEPVLVIYHQKRFFDADLAPLDLTTLTDEPAFTLAIDPATPLTEAVDLRAQLPDAAVRVVGLNAAWQRRLNQMDQR